MWDDASVRIIGNRRGGIRNSGHRVKGGGCVVGPAAVGQVYHSFSGTTEVQHDINVTHWKI